MGKALLERGDGINSPRLFFLGGPFFPLDVAGGEKIYGGVSRLPQQYILGTKPVIRGSTDKKSTPRGGIVKKRSRPCPTGTTVKFCMWI
jgi:hypothetical protein